MEFPALREAVERIRAAAADGRTLSIRGGGTKAFYGEPARGEALETTALRGVTSYEPSELVVTVRAGTPLAELEALLAQEGQCLPFEPPRFARGGTRAEPLGERVLDGGTAAGSAATDEHRILPGSSAAARLAHPAGLEPATRSLEGCCSIQLSYGRVVESARSGAKWLVSGSTARHD